MYCKNSETWETLTLKAPEKQTTKFTSAKSGKIVAFKTYLTYDSRTKWQAV